VQRTSVSTVPLSGLDCFITSCNCCNYRWMDGWRLVLLVTCNQPPYPARLITLCNMQHHPSPSRPDMCQPDCSIGGLKQLGTQRCHSTALTSRHPLHRAGPCFRTPQLGGALQGPFKRVEQPRGSRLCLQYRDSILFMGKLGGDVLPPGSGQSCDDQHHHVQPGGEHIGH